MVKPAYNPDTQEGFVWTESETPGTEGAWAPAQVAVLEDGEVAVYDGKNWLRVGGEVSLAGKVLRKAEQAARGFTDTAVNVATSPIALGQWALDKTGLPQTGIKVAPLDAVHSAFEAVSAPLNEGLDAAGVNLGGPLDTPSDRVARAAGSGAASTAAFLAPAAWMARAQQARLAAVPAEAGEAWAAQAVPVNAVKQKVATAMASQPAVQAVSGATGGAVTEQTGNPWLGLAAGMLTPGATSLARAALPNKQNPELLKLMKIGKQEGIPLSPAQETGSRTLRMMESVFASLPFTGGIEAGKTAARTAAYNKAVLKKAGINSPVATEQVLDDAATKLGQEVEDLASGLVVQADDELVTGLGQIETQLSLHSNSMGSTKGIVREVFDTLADGPISGKAWQEVGSKIRYELRNFPVNNLSKDDLKEYDLLTRVRDMWDDVAVRSSGPEIRPLWADWRQRYRNFAIILETMFKDTTLGAIRGDISPTKLGAVLRARTGTALAKTRPGKNPMYDLSKFGQHFIRDNLPNSGTAERAWMMNLMGGPRGVAAGVGAVGGASALDPGSLMSIAGALGTPVAARGLYAAASPLIRAGARAPTVRTGPGQMANVAAARVLDDASNERLLAYSDLETRRRAASR